MKAQGKRKYILTVVQQALLYVLTTGTIAAWTELAMAHNIDLLDVEGESSDARSCFSRL